MKRVMLVLGLLALAALPAAASPGSGRGAGPSVGAVSASRSFGVVSTGRVPVRYTPGFTTRGTSSYYYGYGGGSYGSVGYGAAVPSEHPLEANPSPLQSYAQDPRKGKTLPTYGSPEGARYRAPVLRSYGR